MWRISHHSPLTLLGRWCGPWYKTTCDVMKKGSFADIDNSVWTKPPPRSDKDKNEKKMERDPISVFLGD